jgi:ankyrin repeat protein
MAESTSDGGGEAWGAKAPEKSFEIFSNMTAQGRLKYGAGVAGMAVATVPAVALSIACLPLSLPSYLLTKASSNDAASGAWASPLFMIAGLPLMGLYAPIALWGFGLEKLNKWAKKDAADGKAVKRTGKLSKEDKSLLAVLSGEEAAGEDKVKALIAAGANPNAVEWRECLRRIAPFCALELAVSSMNFGAAKALLEAGADANARGPLGTGMLADCLTKEYWQDSDFWNSKGTTLAQIYAMGDLLVDHGANPYDASAFMGSIFKHHHGSSRFKGRMCDRADKLGLHAPTDKEGSAIPVDVQVNAQLFKAILENLPELAKSSLAKGASFGSPEFVELASKKTKGWTPLGSAVSRGCVELAGVLLDSGCDPKVPHLDGNLPMRLAMEKADKSSDAREIATLLCSKGVDPMEVIHGGRSAYDHARYLGYVKWAEEMADVFESAPTQSPTPSSKSVKP